MQGILDLSGRTAVITGASSGIGQTIAQRLCHVAGAAVVLVARRTDRLSRVADVVRAEAGKAEPIPID